MNRHRVGEFERHLYKLPDLILTDYLSAAVRIVFQNILVLAPFSTLNRDCRSAIQANLHHCIITVFHCFDDSDFTVHIFDLSIRCAFVGEGHHAGANLQCESFRCRIVTFLELAEHRGSECMCLAFELAKTMLIEGIGIAVRGAEVNRSLFEGGGLDTETSQRLNSVHLFVLAVQQQIALLQFPVA